MGEEIPKQRIAFCTITDSKYLTYGIATYLSLKDCCEEDFDYYNLIVDENIDEDELAIANHHMRNEGINFRFMHMNRLNKINGYEEFLESHLDVDASTEENAKESFGYFHKYDFVRWGSKPFLLKYLLHEYDIVAYCDCDLVFTRRNLISEITDELESANIMVCPQDYISHSTSFACRHGFFNAGFVVASTGFNKNQPLQDWLEMCKQETSVNKGLFVDQKYLDIIYMLYPGRVKVWRNPGCNVAKWNIFYRKIKNQNAEILLDGCPIVFIHNSGNFLFDDDLWFVKDYLMPYRFYYKSVFNKAIDVANKCGIDNDNQENKTEPFNSESSNEESGAFPITR